MNVCQPSSFDAEATLMKLKVGSQHSLISPSTDIGGVSTYSIASLPASDPMKIEANCSAVCTNGCVDTKNSSQEEEMKMDAEGCLKRLQPSSVDFHSVGNSKEECKTVSVLYLFSKYRRDHPAGTSSSGNTTTPSIGYPFSVSPNLSTCNSLESMDQQLERDCVSLLPVTNM